MSGENSGKIQGARSDACPAVRERRATKKLARIHPPEGKPEKWLISLLLLLNVPIGTLSSSRLEIISFFSFSILFYLNPAPLAQRLIRILEENGFILSRQKGSHMIFKNAESGVIVPVPLHGKSKTIPIGTFLAIVKQSKISPDKFKAK